MGKGQGSAWLCYGRVLSCEQRAEEAKPFAIAVIKTNRFGRPKSRLKKAGDLIEFSAARSAIFHPGALCKGAEQRYARADFWASHDAQIEL